MADQIALATQPTQDLAAISEVVQNGPSSQSTPQMPAPFVSNPDIPPPKTDKPRPHVCLTCTRSFARLEHLKRHERSHTKEKPFECPDCTRCFARRDLLLRHQQKLHMATAPAARPRNTRRESTSSSRVRKNSIAGNSTNTMRPRANTISHIEGGAIGLLSPGHSVPRPSQPGHSHHPSLGSVPGLPNFDYQPVISENRHDIIHGLAKLNTAALAGDFSGGLRTAPVVGSFDFFSMGDSILNGSTINPAQLHATGSPRGFHEPPAFHFPNNFSNLSNSQSAIEDDIKFDWLNGFDNTVVFGTANESAIDGSSPSAMSTGSPSGISEAVIDGSKPITTTSASTTWSNPLLSQSQPRLHHFPSLDFQSHSFPEFNQPSETMSPKSILSPGQMSSTSFSTATPMNSMNSTVYTGPSTNNNTFPVPSLGGAVNLSTYSSGYGQNSPPAYLSSITDSTRQALIVALQQPSGFSSGRFSQNSLGNSTASSHPLCNSNMLDGNLHSLPSTYDLQRYVSAYVNYFHPHIPFLHIPTLDFSTSEYAETPGTSAGHNGMNGTNIAVGGGCLILSMAAIGALYEFDTAASRELFEAAKKMIQLYLEERRRADMSATLNRANPGRDNSLQNTPLWLVQAMLLNVIYGHNCGAKTAADIASTHCAALISLARAAELTQYHPPESLPAEQLGYDPSNDLAGIETEMWDHSQLDISTERKQWLRWKIVEERKRTLYAIFTLSSMLVSTYNHAPALTNAEIRLTLPCDEQLWAADSPQEWAMMGGVAGMEQNAIEFSDALKTLLAADQTPHNHFRSSIEGPFVRNAHPSTFGCLVLIHAIHNYIWETRQRHIGKQWTAQETEAMHLHIEPAIRAWQQAWSRNPGHSLERPNPFGIGPLSADSIPLLDLAYLRLYVNLGRTKEAFWQRDWNGIADELTKAVQIVHLSDGSPGSDYSSFNLDEFVLGTRRDSLADYGVADLSLSGSPIDAQGLHNPAMRNGSQVSKSERLLRKAAFYAADSMCMANEWCTTYAEFTSRELPTQSAICLFDCAQILSEWVATVQDRVGPYLGILGQDRLDFGEVPSMMLLEDEDRTLMLKIRDILDSLETKMKAMVPPVGATGSEPWNCLPSLIEGGYGIQIAFSAAFLLNSAGVWPVIKLMSHALEVQGHRLKARAQRSRS
ncbi:hypothetical protein FQN57_001287 [Myotisia sp. PD_48]|nr:hypothetical protein FQN57_001287 [Myotisia sp. PD_48]